MTMINNLQTSVISAPRNRRLYALRNAVQQAKRIVELPMKKAIEE